MNGGCLKVRSVRALLMGLFLLCGLAHALCEADFALLSIGQVEDLRRKDGLFFDALPSNAHWVEEGGKRRFVLGEGDQGWVELAGQSTVKHYKTGGTNAVI